MHKKCISVAFVLTLACVVADSVNSAAPSQERIGGRTMMSEMGLTGTDPVERTGAYAGLLSAFRDSAADKPDEAMAYWFASDARSRWNVLIGGNMIPQQLTDFFMGGILLAGGSSRKGVVAGIYNPWWDALLLVRLSCRETKVGPEDDVFRKVSIEEGRPGAPRAQITEFFFLEASRLSMTNHRFAPWCRRMTL